MSMRIILTILGSIMTQVYSNCDPRLPHCTQQANQPGTHRNCNPFWLIPGKTMDCTKSSSTKLISIDSHSINITPKPIKLPGCFTISMKVQIQQQNVPKSFFSKVEYKAVKLPQFGNLPCQNASGNGCGGYGNNCYYCDICNSLHQIDQGNPPRKSSIVSQFKHMSCPDKAGVYDFKREFCFNDFHELDKDNDCQLDFISNKQTGQNYGGALKDLKSLGYGTILAKFTLAYNATPTQASLKTNKESQIERETTNELETKRKQRNWAVDDKQYTTFHNWYIQNRKDIWHKQQYLPYLLYYNEVGCLTVSFDICDKMPIFSSSGNRYVCL